MQRNTGDTQCWLTHDQPFWSLVSELQRQVLAKISPTFGGCPQSQHGHQDLAATLSIERHLRIKPSRSKGRCSRETCQTKFKPRCHTQVGQDVAKVQSSIRKCCSNSSPGSVREHKKKGGIETVPTQQSKESPEANTKPKNGSRVLLFLGKGDEAPQQGDFSKGLHHDGETLQNRHLDGVVSSAQPKISLLGLHKSLEVKLI